MPPRGKSKKGTGRGKSKKKNSDLNAAGLNSKLLKEGRDFLEEMDPSLIF